MIANLIEKAIKPILLQVMKNPCVILELHIEPTRSPHFTTQVLGIVMMIVENIINGEPLDMLIVQLAARAIKKVYSLIKNILIC